MTTAVIAEDEKLLAGEIREELARLWPELDVRAVVHDGHQALRAIERAPARRPLPRHPDARADRHRDRPLRRRTRARRLHHRLQPVRGAGVRGRRGRLPAEADRSDAPRARAAARQGAARRAAGRPEPPARATAARAVEGGAALDHGAEGPRGHADHGRGRLLLPGRQQVRRRRHRRRRGADHDLAAGSARRSSTRRSSGRSTAARSSTSMRCAACSATSPAISSCA